MGGGNGVILTEAQIICLSCSSFVVFGQCPSMIWGWDLLHHYLKLRFELENT